jgi:isoquinoline 1-oxidoreductase beta subunit
MSATPKPVKQKRMSRRGFLILLGAGAVGLYVGVRLATPPVRLALAHLLENAGGPPASISAPPDAWFQITPENKVRLYLPKSEMGQGVHTALAQIAAEELEIAWEQLEVLHAGTGHGLEDSVGTSASTSISTLYKPLRETAATLRELLRAEAARRLNIPGTDLVAAKGAFSVKGDAARQVSYGQLFQAAGSWTLPKEPPALKPQGEFKVIGSAAPRVDLAEKVTGKAVYGFDVRLPGMLYGAVARPSTIEGKLRSAKPGAAAGMPGVVKVVIEDGFAGVVAESRVQAYQALDRLELQWDNGKPWQQAEIDALVTVGNGEGVVIQQEGDVEAAVRAAAGPLVEAEYRSPMAYHAYLEPLAAAADVRADQVQVWASTQSAVRLRGKIAAQIKRDAKTVFVTPVYLGGGLGRKIDETAAVDAARLSAAVGRPVHVGLFRSQDFLNGYLRPSTHHRLRGVLDASGRVQSLEHRQASGEVAFPFVPDFLGAVLGADFGAWRGALSQYAIANRQTTAWLAKMPVPTGWWRGLGLFANTFALESFMDELAFAAKADPLEFRLRHLPPGETGQRLKTVLQTAAERAGWGKALPAGHALGIACCADVRTLVAEVAEVGVENGKIRVYKITAAVDPGLVINPSGVEAQTLGAITMGLSSTLLEEVTVQDGVLQAANFDRYPLLRNADAPEVVVVPLQSGPTPFGMGEPPIGPVAAAVANAVFAATGRRLRSLPLRLG